MPHLVQLTACPNCGETIASGSTYCPACGAAQRRPATPTPSTGGILLAVLLVLLAVPLAIVGGFFALVGTCALAVSGGKPTGAETPFVLAVLVLGCAVALCALAAWVIVRPKR